MNTWASTYNGRHYICKVCHIKQTGAWRAAHPENTRAHQKRFARSPGGLFNRARLQAKDRGIPWALSREEYNTLRTSVACTYCRGPLAESGVGLDRKDSSLGYVRDNVVPCCGMCNKIKNNHLNFSEMLLLAPVLKQIRLERLEKQSEAAPVI